jgi:cell division control protein 12
VNNDSLKPLDIEVMKQLGSRVNLIPVLAKADTLSADDLIEFKRRIRDVIEEQEIQVYSCPIDSDTESSSHRNQNIMAGLPFSVIGSDQDVKTSDGRVVKGRDYPWGIAEGK